MKRESLRESDTEIGAGARGGAAGCAKTAGTAIRSTSAHTRCECLRSGKRCIRALYHKVLVLQGGRMLYRSESAAVAVDVENSRDVDRRGERLAVGTRIVYKLPRWLGIVLWKGLACTTDCATRRERGTKRTC